MNAHSYPVRMRTRSVPQPAPAERDASQPPGREPKAGGDLAGNISASADATPAPTPGQVAGQRSQPDPFPVALTSATANSPDAAQQSEGDDDVGYCKPPKWSRFKKGERRNPNGRPKGSKNALTIFHEELLKEVTVVDGGRRRKMTKLQVGARKLANSFAEKSDLKSALAILKMFEILGGNAPAGDQQGASEAGGKLLPSDGIMLDWYVDTVTGSGLTREFDASQSPEDADDAADSRADEPRTHAGGSADE